MKDPIKKAEDMVKGVHDGAGKYTKPVLKRYPLLFSFLSVFSFAAILRGFDMWVEQIGLFEEHPAVLILIGVIALLFTGTLYKTLENVK
jgi:hypothetical protein